jgi:cobalt/nickel transport system permease protein
MHIPDGFLSFRVWAALDSVAIPAVLISTRRAQSRFDDSRAPLMGVMGAFVFAAQMINFPVGVGTSSHLVGAALLSYVLGPAPAVVVMTAILVIQSTIFQDGGLAALGANVCNMALAGVLAGYLPFALLGSGRSRKFALFLGGFLSLLVSAALAMTELLLSGIRMPTTVIAISSGLFFVSALLEGIITLSVGQAIERLNPMWAPSKPAAGRGLWALAGVAVVLVAVGFLFASQSPDGLEKLVQTLGLSPHEGAAFAPPLADYEWRGMSSIWLRKASAGMAGLLLVAGACLGFGRFLGRQRSA